MPSKMLLSSLNFRSSKQISIAEIGDEFVWDFELSGNLDYISTLELSGTHLYNIPYTEARRPADGLMSHIGDMYENLTSVDT